MDGPCHQNRRKLKNSNRRNIRNRLGFTPIKHKNKFTKERRALLRQVDGGARAPAQVASLKFGSFNVRGLDLESAWEIQNIIQSRGFDVSNLGVKFTSKTQTML